ncbi:MAG: hybrid sensor histidine kinase/response regulator [Herminiimonas sp.]|nr:hybrid sensor histidine kinase/response regulator [Herminiimonas sp.]
MALRERAGSEATIVSDVYLAPVGKSYSVAVQVPVKRNGRVAFYLGLGSFTRQLQSVFKEQQMPAGWIGTIIDRNGVVAARSHEPEKFVGTPVRQDLVKVVQENREGFHDWDSLNGVPVTGFFNRAPASEWTFVVNVPRNELQQTVIRATALMVGIALVLLGLAIALALIVGRKTAEPIEALRLAAANLRRGEPVTIQPSGVMELDAVSIEMVRASEEVRSTRVELETRVADAVATAERSQRSLLQAQKLEALGRLTGGIAHDFNNLLQTLSTGLQVAHLSSTEPRVRKPLESCQRAVDRAAELIRQLLAFGRVQDARLATIDLPRHIFETTPMLKSGLRSDVQLHLDIADEIWPVTVDPLQLELAVLNLTINARDAMPSGGGLTIRIRNSTLHEPVGELMTGDYVQIAVIDAGTGMSQDVLAKALDPFFTTKSVGRGSGMGLPQAYGFANQAGGTLILESKPGKGTTVTLYLPRATAALTAIQAGKGSLQPGTLSGRILLVEDDPLVADVVVPALEATGLTVRVAQSGDEAVAVLNAEQAFDVVFSDIVMPGQVSGIDLAEIIRNQFPATPVVLATGYSERRVTVPGVRILAKPYDLAEVVDALHSELRKKAANS